MEVSSVGMISNGFSTQQRYEFNSRTRVSILALSLTILHISTSCRARRIIINVKCSKGTARRETLDLEEDVCSSHNQSLHLVELIFIVIDQSENLVSKVPYKLKFDPETLSTCTKLSGLAVSYSEKPKFDSIVRFLSKR